MLKQKHENRAFWLFLLWILIIPFIHQAGLSAQEKDTAIEEEVIEETSDSDVVAEPAKEESLPEEAPAEEESDGVEEDAPEKLPALSIDPAKLLGEVSGMAKSKKPKWSTIAKKLAEHEDAVETDGDLLEIYVEALLNAKKPAWKQISKFARTLTRKKRKSSIGHYAVALGYINAKKPNLAKALKSLEKAKKAKKPYPAVAMTYYKVLVKKYWKILLAVIVLPIMVIAVIIKKKKAAAAKPIVEINLDLDNLEDVASSETPVEASNETVQTDVASPNEDGSEAPVKEDEADKAKKESQNLAGESSANSEELAEQIPVNEAVTSDIEKPENISKGPIESEINAPELNKPSVEPQTDQPAELISSLEPVMPQNSATEPQQAAVKAQSESATKAGPVISMPNRVSEEVKQLVKPPRRDPVASDPELDAIWSRLCRKALDKRIPQMHRDEKEVFNRKVALGNRPGAGTQDESRGGGFKFSAASFGKEDSAANANVSIDLSEEAIRDDLIGKLKMLAITDSELRKLLALKNPKHIPYLIEYVLTKPEPLRLSFIARELGYYQDPAVLDLLASLLYNEDERVVLAAIQGLENSRNPAAILHICPFIKSEVPVWVQAARSALSNFGAVTILETFMHLPDHPDENIKEAGIFVLSRMKGEQVEDLLATMLNDESEFIQSKVVLAMSYQKNPVYIEELREFYRKAKGEPKALARKAIVYLQAFKKA